MRNAERFVVRNAEVAPLGRPARDTSVCVSPTAKERHAEMMAVAEVAANVRTTVLVMLLASARDVSPTAKTRNAAAMAVRASADQVVDWEKRVLMRVSALEIPAASPMMLRDAMFPRLRNVSVIRIPIAVQRPVHGTLFVSLLQPSSVVLSVEPKKRRHPLVKDIVDSNPQKAAGVMMAVC